MIVDHLQSSTSAPWVMAALLRRVMPTTLTIAMTPWSEKRVCEETHFLSRAWLTVTVCVSSLMIEEIKRIIKDSEILKYVS